MDEFFDPETATPEEIKARADAQTERLKATIVVMTIVSAIQDPTKSQDERFNQVIDLIVGYGDQRVFESRLK